MDQAAAETAATAEEATDQRRRGRMGVTAKKAIGMMATATAATIVTMSTDTAKVEFVSHDDTANVPARKRRPIAEASATINPIILLRRRRLKSFWSDMVVPRELLVSKLAAIVGMKSPRDVRIGESSSLDVRWLQSGRGSEPPEKRSSAPCCSTMREVKRAVLR